MDVVACGFCGAPATLSWSSAHAGVDFDGADAVFDMQRWTCVRGHYETRTILAAVDPLDTEDEDRIVGEVLAEQAAATLDLGDARA